jgi:hypothetical protein
MSCVVVKPLNPFAPAAVLPNNATWSVTRYWLPMSTTGATRSESERGFSPKF